MDAREERIKKLKAELQKLESQGKLPKKKGVFNALRRSGSDVFKSLGAAGKKVLSNPAGQKADISNLDKVIKSLPQ
jgi:hypothetical protein